MFLPFFIFLSIVCAVLVSKSWAQSSFILSSPFKAFRSNYLVVFLLMSGADWLQGPYVYALYQSYNFSIGQIGQLFIAGFGSSALFGSFVGFFSDKYGRRTACIAYGILYSLSCITKHFPSYSILMLGRILGGISTSILFSAFESWMIAEHAKNAFPEEWLSSTFALCTFSNSVIAIASGVVAGFAASVFGVVAPFDMSLCCLAIGTYIVHRTWPENYGNQTIQMDVGLSKAFETIMQDKNILHLGLAQSLFEAAMYIFVFMWTPALARFDPQLSHGLIFACFMVCVMIGSTLFKMLLADNRSIESFLPYVFIVAALCLSAPIFASTISTVVVSFFVFEICVGLFWPAVGTLRSKHIPESSRSTIMNYFRLPTNALVVTSLFAIEVLSQQAVFLICVLALSVCAFSAFALARNVKA